MDLSNRLPKIYEKKSAEDENSPNLVREEFTDLSDAEFVRLKDILDRYYRSIENRKVTDSTINYEHEIVLNDNIPVASKPRLLPHTYEEEIDTQILQLLKDNIIKPSHMQAQ